MAAYHLFETAFGWCGLAWSEAGVTHLQLPEGSREKTGARLREQSSGAVGEPPPFVLEAARELQRYLEGARVDFAGVRLDLAGGSPFHRAVYDVALSIPWGGTSTYGELARRAGSPGAARAVGQAMARNPIPVIIPCHRVLASGDLPGGFSAYGGLSMKQRLLELEGVRLKKPTGGEEQLTLSGVLDV